MRTFAEQRPFQWIIYALTLASAGCIDSESKIPAQSAVRQGTASSKTTERNWSSLLGPNGNASIAVDGLNLSFGSSGPDVLWRYKAGQGYSAPVVHNDQIVLFHRLEEQECIDLIDKNGKRIWRHAYPTSFVCEFEYSSGPYSTPVIDENSIYAWSAEGALRCLNRATGEEQWSRNLSVEYDVPEPDFPVATSPLLHEGRLILNVGGGRDSTGIMAVDSLSGETLWSATTEQAAYATPVMHRIHGRDIALVLGFDFLTALSPSTGEVLWQEEFHARNRSLGRLNATSPLVVGNRIFLAANNRGAMCIEVLPDASRKVNWDVNARILSSQMAPLTSSQQGLIGYCTTNRTLRCLRRENASVIWEWKSTMGREPQYLLADPYILMLGEYGNLAVFKYSAKDIQQLTLTDTPLLEGPCYTAPIIASARLFLRNEKELVCCDLRVD